MLRFILWYYDIGLFATILGFLNQGFTNLPYSGLKSKNTRGNNPMKILIIEDEKKIARLLRDGLEKEGFEVDYSADGGKGQRKIERYHKDYNLVILDLMLPGKTGFEICRDIREKNISVPILILTARSGVEDKALAMNLGADDYMLKPFSFRDLLTRIRGLEKV